MIQRLYDARGNRYVVAGPDQISPPLKDAATAATSHGAWAGDAIQEHCHPHGEASPISDGLVIGPFEAKPPFTALIVNTDGSLAERSGNGLTIFAQALRDEGRIETDVPFDVNVHHATPGISAPVKATLTPVDHNGEPSVWIAMGQPAFGPDAVDASAAIAATSTPRRDTNHVAELADVDVRWSDSVLVRIGNPHCVTWIKDEKDLPSFDALDSEKLHVALRPVAFTPASNGTVDRPFSHGINLQWAARLAPDRVAARIFERGEGATRSSGSSATAVACAARQVGIVETDTVHVEMPGGVAEVRFTPGPDDAFSAEYLGVAERI